MLVRLGWLAVVLGIALRLAACVQHEVPRGDVVLDTGVAASLLEGRGFAAGFERGLALVAGDDPVPRQDLADQHPPLWPLLGAALAGVAGSPFGGLKVASFLAGLLLLVLVYRVTDRLLEGVPGAPDGLPALAAGLAALSFLLVDASGNGSLYAAQAALVLLLVEALAAPRPSPLVLGLLLGLAWLLNHQCLVLLPVPLLVLLVAARPGEARRALLTGLGALAVALLLQVPWWLRNAQVFGDPFHSTNGFYLLNRVGVPYGVGLEGGHAVARFAHGLDLATAVKALPSLLLPNVLYVLVAGLLVWPGLLGPLLAGVLPLARAALTGRERRPLALVACAAVLLAVSVAWPAVKLRYLVALAPLLLTLGLRVLARAPGRSEARLGLVVVAAWAALVAVTLDDLLGGPEARPVRWQLLAGGGLLLLVLPLLLHRRQGAVGAGRVLLLSGLPLAPLLALGVLVLPGPGTAYHGAPFLPDFFGQDKEGEAAREAEALRWAAEVLRQADSRSVAAPVDLLAHLPPGLVSLPAGADAELLALCLRGRLAQLDHVVLLEDAGAALVGGPPLPGESALDGRLLVVARRPADGEGAGAAVLEVVRR